jgi:c-di-GMP-binding flagellar brake protein YcgR
MEWRRCLQQVCERGGALEIALAPNYEENGAVGRHLIWRVKLLALTDKEIIVEQPTTLGQPIEIKAGLDLVAILAIGQNRWMFWTKNRGPVNHSINGRRTVSALRLEMPASVERCQRRNYYRVETASLKLPEVEVWPLLDPKSVLVAERANELRFQADRDGPRAADDPEWAEFNSDSIMPEVGPKFTAILLNIGGGGVGLRVKPADNQALSRHKLFWLRFTLPPELRTPICATGKLVHTNVDSTQHTYAGMAFDFSFNAVHQRFVVEQITRYISRLQAAAMRQQGAA